MRKVLILMLLAACSACVFLCGCAIPWFIPIDYSAAKIEKMYSAIRTDFAASPDNFSLAIYDEDCVTYLQKSGDGVIFFREKYAIDSDGEYTTISHVATGVDGVYKEYDVATQSETTRDIAEGEFDGYISKAQSFLNYVAYDLFGVESWSDGKIYKCFPWGYGMAQIYYDVDKTNDSIYDVSAAWTVNSSGAPVAPQISYGDKSYTIMVNFEEEQIDLSVRGASYLQNYEELIASSAT